MESRKVYKSHNLNCFLEYFEKLTQVPANSPQFRCLGNGMLLEQVLQNIGIVRDSLKCQQTQANSYCLKSHGKMTFIEKFTSLKKVINSINKFWNEELQLVSPYHQQIDVVTAARKQDENELEKLCCLVLQTLFQAEEKQLFLQKVLQVSQQTKVLLMNILQEGQQRTQTTMSSNSSQQSPDRSKDHTVYEKLFQMETENSKLFEMCQEFCQQRLQHEKKEQALNQSLSEAKQQIRLLNISLSEAVSKTVGSMTMSDSFVREIDRHEQIVQSLEEEKEKSRNAEERFRNCQSELTEQSRTVKELERKLQRALQECKDNQSLSQKKIFNLERQLSEKSDIFSDLENKHQELTLEAAQAKSQNDEKIAALQLTIKNQQNEIQALEAHLHQLQNSRSVQRDSEGKQGSLCENLEIHSQIGKNHDRESELSEASMIMRLREQIAQLKYEVEEAYAREDRKTAQIQKLKIHHVENVKLVDIISHMTRYRGEENEMLVHCVYGLRKRIFQLEKERLEFSGVDQPFQNKQNLHQALSQSSKPVTGRNSLDGKRVAMQDKVMN